jgi:molecular chaperone HtpG
MGTKLYGDTDVALRELLQNSIDACLLRQAQEKKWGNPYIPVINVKYYTEDGEEILEVDDNGTGMDHYIIDKYYSNIGSSFYKSIDFYNLKAESNAEFTPTSRFGIGILSCFMVADTLCVDTKRVYANHMSSDSLNIIVEGQESIFLITPGKRELPGTTTKLYLRKTQNPWEKMTENEFIDSVEEIIPNPPFKINIQTLSQNKSRDENSFKLFDTNSLKDYTWRSHENIREFNISFNEVGKGFVGHGIVAILETQGEATDDVDIHRKEIEIDGNKYDLKKKILLKENKIWQESSSISISDDGEITEDSSSTYLAKSKSMFSLHGIEIPTSLFPDSWTIKKNQACISWPFPLILVLDVCGTYDLDLNSSRTQVIISDKWMNFEEELAFSVCQALCLSVSKDYWKNLKRIFIQNTKNPRFLRSLRRVKFQSKK